MSKQGRSGRGWHMTATDRSTGGRCLSCRRPIIHGDRCQHCQQRLRQRKRRKLHR